MARINLHCECGWNFFVSDAKQQAVVSCPACSQPVRLPGRGRQGPPIPPAQIAAEKAGQKRTLLLLILSLGAVAVVAVILVVVTTDAPPPEEAPSRPAAQAAVRPDSEPSPPPSSSKATVREITPPLPPGRSTPATVDPQPSANPEEIKNQVHQLVARINVAGITAEFLRHKNLTVQYDAVVKHMEDLDAQIPEKLSRLADVGVQQPVPPHLKPGDRIVWFDSKGIASLSPAERAAHLSRWLRTYHAGVLDQCTVERGADKINLIIFLKDRSKDTLALAEQAGALIDPEPIAVGSALPPPGTPPTPRYAETAKPLPEDVLKQVEDRMAALPPGYLQLFKTDERQRLQGLLQAKKGLPVDVAFLNARVLGEMIPRCEQDAALIRAKTQELEPKAMQIVVSDVIFFKDGRTVEGKVEGETEESLKVRTRFGAVTVMKADVAKVERNKGSLGEFPDRYKAAGGKVEALVPLMAWCKEKNHATQKEFLCYLILTLDAAHDRARGELGLTRDPAGAASAVAESDPRKRIDAAVAEALRKYTTFADVIAEMQRLTEGVQLISNVAPPDKFVDAARIITDPTKFKPRDQAPGVSTWFDGWWKNLTMDDRRNFARFFAQWAAAIRAGSVSPR